jgi:hypothetical protein
MFSLQAEASLFCCDVVIPGLPFQLKIHNLFPLSDVNWSFITSFECSLKNRIS